MGGMIRGFTTKCLGRGSSHVAEAIAFREASNWIKRQPMNNVLFELHSLLVVQAVHSLKQDRFDYECLI
ncbi:hypothetical protein Sjap_007793 [Stephania japonica]|uniref:Ig-like domain-containing protein n=1 Tax=Stephania japonica TaxID=461633 RepID=A0AAP0PBN6_9MAGN